MDTYSWRVLDANANRAAEGLRTIEDHARLVSEDEVAVGWIKSLRDQLSQTLRKVNRYSRLTARSTDSDAGTDITSTGESQRKSQEDIVSAAAERVTQALRQLEEYSKFLDEEVSSDFKQLRYKAYDILARLELRLARPADTLNAAHVYVLIDCSKPLSEFGHYLNELAEAGVDWFQLRDKMADGGQLLQYARTAQAALAETASKLIINDRVDVALACKAAGVHLGQEDLSMADARRLVGNSMLIGISTHSVEQAIEAEQAGADYIGCGPTFPSTTKQFSEFVGPEMIRRVHQAVGLPVFAIGGIDASNIELLAETGCRRVALAGAVHNAANPASQVTDIKSVLTRSTLAQETESPILKPDMI